MVEPPIFLAERLKTEGEKTVLFFETLTDAQWGLTLYADGETWTILNVLAHFVMSEHSLNRLFFTIQAGGVGVSEDFDIDSYNAAHQEQARAQSAQELLAQFKVTRARLVDWVSTLNDGDLEKTGRHPFLGVTTLAEMIKLIYRHNQLHLRDIRKIVNQ